MNDERQATQEYLRHLINRAQGQEIMAANGSPGGREEELVRELNQLSGLIHRAYCHVLAALEKRG